MNKFIKLATYNFFFLFIFILIDNIFGLSIFPQTSTPVSELPFYVSIPVLFMFVSFFPVWFWVLYKMVKNRYFFWFLIVLFMPPIAFFVTTKHYNV